MLSRSKGRHKFTFQQLSLSLNPKIVKNIIIGIGLVSSLVAFLMILDFAGLKLESLQVEDISHWKNISMADILTGFGNAFISILGSIPISF